MIERKERQGDRKRGRKGGRDGNGGGWGKALHLKLCIYWLSAAPSLKQYVEIPEYAS